MMSSIVRFRCNSFCVSTSQHLLCVFSNTCVSFSQSPQLNTTVNSILTAFNERIQAKDWLDPKTKKLCEQKVDCTAHLVGGSQVESSPTYAQ